MMNFQNRIIIPREEWINTPLAAAELLGSIRIHGRVYYYRRRGYLIRDDYARLLGCLKITTLLKADKRYGTGRKSLRILKRLSRIAGARRAALAAQEVAKNEKP